MERLTLVVTVWAVRRVIWVIGSWAGVTLQMTFLPGIPTQSPSCQSVQPFLRECQTPHGREPQSWRQTMFQTEMRAEMLKTSPWENISLPFEVTFFAHSICCPLIHLNILEMQVKRAERVMPPKQQKETNLCKKKHSVNSHHLGQLQEG